MVGYHPFFFWYDDDKGLLAGFTAMRFKGTSSNIAATLNLALVVNALLIT